MLADIRSGSLRVRIEDLLASLAGDQCLTDVLDFALDIINGHLDRGDTVKTRAIDGQYLAARCVALMMADLDDAGHHLHVVALLILLVVACQHCACVIPSEASSPEECLNLASFISSSCFYDAPHSVISI